MKDLKFALPGDFFDVYWQHRPLLIRGALRDFQSPISGDDLAGLSLMEEVESRLVIWHEDLSDWEVRDGPLLSRTFDELPEYDWTLLVQAVDHWDEAVADLRRSIPGVPAWRLDDVMMSYAAIGGSVGPHVDQYDVFLLQGEGQREWRLGGQVEPSARRREHPHLDLLQDFEEVQTYVLEPGDALYVPPGHAHWGTAITPCITYSIGFRAPGFNEILDANGGYGAALFGPDQRYRDSLQTLQASSHPGEITAETVTRFAEIIRQCSDESHVAGWLGQFLTEPKFAMDEADATSVMEALQSGRAVRAALQSRFAFIRADHGFTLFADGIAIPCPLAGQALVQRLCDGEVLRANDFDDFSLILQELAELGCLQAD